MSTNVVIALVTTLLTTNSYIKESTPYWVVLTSNPPQTVDINAGTRQHITEIWEYELLTVSALSRTFTNRSTLLQRIVVNQAQVISWSNVSSTTSIWPVSFEYAQATNQDSIVFTNYNLATNAFTYPPQYNRP